MEYLKKIRNVVFMMVMVIAFSSMNDLVYGDTVRGVTMRACPYTCDPVLDDGKDGFMVEIAKVAFRRAGHTYTVKIEPFPRAMKSVVDGTYDAMTVCNPADVSESDLLFPEVTSGLATASFIVRKGETWKYTGVESLKQIRLGSVVGYTWSNEAVNQYLQNTQFPAVQNISVEEPVKNNLLKLRLNRTDAYLDIIESAKYMASKIGINFDKEFASAGDLEKTPHYTAFYPQHPKAREYARIMSEGMRALRASGKLAQILAKYGLKDWEQP